MRGTKAKKLRKLVYGDNSLKVRNTMKLSNGQVVNTGLRAEYQGVKRIFKSGKEVR